MSKQKGNKEFKVAIYANEYKQMCAWGLKNEVLKTGGDLFGLWSSDHTAVEQLVLGPEKDCRHAEHSFYQDVDYLGLSSSSWSCPFELHCTVPEIRMARKNCSKGHC